LKKEDFRLGAFFNQSRRKIMCDRCKRQNLERKQLIKEMRSVAAQQEMLDSLPERYGVRRLMSRDPKRRYTSGKLRLLIPVQCECGRSQLVLVTDWLSGRCGTQCKSCALRKLKRTGGGALRVPINTELGLEQAKRREAFRSLEWNEDKIAQKFLADNGAMNQSEIADFYGYTRANIQAIESKALAKLKKHCECRKIDFEEFLYKDEIVLRKIKYNIYAGRKAA
jgi:hypothetical protein